MNHAVAAVRRFWGRAVVGRLGDPAWRTQAGLVAGVLTVLTFVVRVVFAEWPGQFTIFFPDSFSFKNVARLTPFAPAFYAAERPIAYPTLLFLLGRSTVVTVVVQTALYGFAYFFAAIAAWRVLRSNVARIACTIGLVMIAVQPRFALWNTHILSESLGQTLAVVSVTCWWLFAAAPSVRSLRWAGVATIGWITVRDSNVPPWISVGVPALFAASIWWRSAEPALRRSMRTWAIITLVVGLAAAAGQAANGRNRYATMNNIGLRVLDNPELTEWFVDFGLPLDDALQRRAGASSFDNGWDVLTSPELAEYREWADGTGQRVMLLSYVRFAPHWIDSLYDDLPAILHYRGQDYDAFGVTDRLPDSAPMQLGGATTRGGLVVWTLFGVLGLVLTFMSGRRLVAAVGGLLLGSAFIDLYIAYVGDSVEVLRHMVGPLARLALITLICVCHGIDSVATWRRER